MKRTSSELFLLSHEQDEEHPPKQMTIPQKLQGLNLVFKEHCTDVIVYAGDIGSPADKEFMKGVIRNKLNDNVLLLLATYGGVPASAYRMARSLTSYYENVTIFVNDYCKSSGTLLALGAHEIVIGPCGEFGPLDIQVLNKEEFNERNSGLDTTYSLQVLAQESTNLFRRNFSNVRMGGMLSTKQALEAATNLTVGLLKPVYEQLEPLKMGQITRLMRIASEYGSKLDVGNLKDGALNRLITDYPEHGYVIDNQEARDSIFKNVRDPYAYEQVLWNLLDDIINNRMSTNEILMLFLNEFDDVIEEQDGDCKAESLEQPDQESDSPLNSTDDSVEIEQTPESDVETTEAAPD